MGLLKSILQGEQQRKKNLGVCIPDSRKEKTGAKPEPSSKQGSSFTVSGIFQFHESLMLQGRMSSGIARKNGKITVGRSKLLINDLQVGNKSVETITPGETGALFLKPERGKSPIIRVGDVLEF